MPPPRRPRSLPQLVEDAVGEILLRIPPDDPASLVRASAVCRTWHDILADPAFPACYREFHRTSPVLGAFRNDAVFVPTNSFRPLAAEHSGCVVLDCRHGRVLLQHLDSEELVVWDPITGHQCLLPEVPDTISFVLNGAVLCAAAAAAGCRHLDCHGGPFLVAVVGACSEGQMHACVYSSETGDWSGQTSVEFDYIPLDPSCVTVDIVPAALVGEALYFIGDFGDAILRYDLVEHSLWVIDLPDLDFCYDGAVVMPEEDGELGFAVMESSWIYLWSMETGPDGDNQWKQRTAIDLKTLLPVSNRPPHLSGFVDGANCIVVTTKDAVFTIELKSLQTRKVCKRSRSYCGFLYTSFYTPACGIGRLPSPVASGD